MSGDAMLPLYRDPWFTFRFGECRRVDIFFLEGVEPGRRVAIHALDPDTQSPGTQIGSAVVGEAGRIELTVPLLMQPGDGFLVLVLDE